MFNLQKSEDLKAEGMARAAAVREVDVEMARGIARVLCRGKRAEGQDPTTNADEVGMYMEDRGFKNLGAAAGSIFRGKEFEFTGERINSARETNHARELKVWRLTTL